MRANQRHSKRASLRERAGGVALLALVLGCGAGGNAADGADGGGASTGDGATSAPLPQGSGGAACGAASGGTSLHVADNVDVCLPPVVCTAETCPPAFGACEGGRCRFAAGYSGVTTLPEAWATHYCALSTGGCHGVTQIDFPEVTARDVAPRLGQPVCDGASSATGTCVGIAASSPMLVGNSQVAIDPANGRTVASWGLGLTEASGLCYAISGPGGSAVVALTDRCGGYCKCGGSGFQECGPCVSASDMQPNCPCVGSTPSSACCGRGCATLDGSCDWCASNNHPHFDLDDATFNWVCGADAANGSCRLTRVGFVPCATPKGWPPGGGGGGCGAKSFHCEAAAPHQDAVPGTSCCCDYDQCAQPDGSCAPSAAPCGAGSCACPASGPDGSHPKVASTGCCCVLGAAPQSDGSCK